jgi:hypothetical protein
MDTSWNALAELLARKTPEAMYDALYAGRYLSREAEDSPPELLAFLKAFLRSSRQRALMPSNLLPRLVAALARSGFLNEAGKRLAAEPSRAPPIGFRIEPSLPVGAEWLDLWHTHVDWTAHGNRSAAARHESLAALFAAWEEVDAWAVGLTRPWQSWLVIDAEDSGQDAVYLHTPNPNRDNFPYAFDRVDWDMTAPTWLAPFLTAGLQLGLSDNTGAILYWVRRAEETARA